MSLETCGRPLETTLQITSTIQESLEKLVVDFIIAHPEADAQAVKIAMIRVL